MIDAHVHVWTDDWSRYPFASGYRREDAVLDRFTPQDIRGHADPVGVKKIVLVQMSYYGFDNSYMLDVIEESPASFAGIAVIDRNAKDVEAEMERLACRGVRGFRIHPAGVSIEDWLQEPGFDRMFEVGASRGLALCPLINPSGLPSLERQCERFPEAPVIIDHLCLIGADGTIRDNDVDLLCAMACFPHAMVKVSAFYALGRKAAPYEDLKELIRRVFVAFGARRLMWASDSPFQVISPHTYEDSVRLTRDRLEFLTAEDRDWMMRGTAESFFFSRRTRQ